jgi:hypothetical protein
LKYTGTTSLPSASAAVALELTGVLAGICLVLNDETNASAADGGFGFGVTSIFCHWQFGASVSTASAACTSSRPANLQSQAMTTDLHRPTRALQLARAPPASR